MANGIYPKDRRCPWEDESGAQCITILHTSNPGPLCECHEAIAQAQRNRRRRLRDLARAVNRVGKNAQFAVAS